ncbi:MAG: response regulator [Crocinitomicaceae bacterium]|nr:response regulator [Crocinitomicaceae bacterium]
MELSKKKLISIAIIDDNQFYVDFVKKWLTRRLGSSIFQSDCTVRINAIHDPATLKLDKEKYDIAFLDYYLDDNCTAIDLIPEFKKYQPDCEVYVTSQQYTDLTAYHTIDKGATGFLFKGDKDLLFKTCALIEQKIQLSA